MPLTPVELAGADDGAGAGADLPPESLSILEVAADTEGPAIKSSPSVGERPDAYKSALEGLTHILARPLAATAAHDRLDKPLEMNNYQALA